MNYMLLILIGFLAVDVSYGTSRAQEFTDRVPTLLISLDGFRADKLDKYLQENPDSSFQKYIVSKGVKAKFMKPSFPSLTFPNHHSIITGKYIDKHDIVGNTIYDPEYNIKINLLNGNATVKLSPMFWNTTEPLWLTAKNQGLKTASFFWAGSEVWTRHPNFFLMYNDLYLFTERCDEVVSWFKLFNMDFVTLYFDEPDHTGHSFGPDSTEYWNKIKLVDETLTYLFDKLKKEELFENINIVVVSDHGMATMRPPNETVIVQDYVPDMNKTINYQKSNYGIVSHIYPRNDSEELKQKVYQDLKKMPNVQVFLKEEIPKELNYYRSRRIGPIVVIADEGYSVSDYRQLSLAGNHGFNNSLVNMRAIFMARGPNFKKNVIINEFENVNVYFLLCKLINIKALPGDGSLKPFESILVPNAKPQNSASIIQFNFVYLSLFISIIINKLFN